MLMKVATPNNPLKKLSNSNWGCNASTIRIPAIYIYIYDTKQCQVIEQLDAAHKSNLMHSRIKLVTDRKRGNNTTTCIEDKNGDIIMEKDEILSRWAEYIGELYNDDNRGDMPDTPTEVESLITRRVVEHAIRGMSENKSPGPNGITTEMLVAAGEIGILELTANQSLLETNSCC